MSEGKVTDSATAEDFKITSRIEQLLVRIAEANYASINEMNLYFTSNGHVYRVLRGLLAVGILDKIKTNMVPSKVYHLTARGYQFIEQKGLLRGLGRFQPSDFRITTCYHNLTCLGVRILLEHILGAENWKTEKRLNYARSEMGIEGFRLVKRVTDAEFDLGQIHVGVEVELTLKSPQVLKKNVENLNDRIRRNGLHNVFWITRRDNVIDAVRRACGMEHENRLLPLSDVNASHLFINYQELVEKKADALVVGLSGKMKHLKEIL